MNQMVFLLYSGIIQPQAERDLKLARLSAIISPYLFKFMKHHKSNTALVHKIVSTFSPIYSSRVTYVINSFNLKKYGIRLSHIFEITTISNEKPSISIEIPSISIKNLGFRLKYQVFRIRNFEILGFHTLNLKYQVFRAKYLVFRKLGISTKNPVPRRLLCPLNAFVCGKCLDCN